MEKAAQKISSSRKLRWIVIYLTIITTLAAITVGYNQHTTCSTQKDNVENTLARNAALDKVITEQVKLYKIVEKMDVPVGSEFRDSLNDSIVVLKESRNIIKDAPPSTVKCLIVGVLNNGNSEVR